MIFTRRETLPIFGAAGITAAGAFGGLNGLLGSSTALAEDLSTLMDPGPFGEHIIGDPEAPVTIIEYASMTCPHCRAFHINTFPAIKEKYIDTGVAKLYFREFPFDPAAAAAFMLAECAGEEKYFSMIDILYEKQSTWSRGKVVEELFKIAKLAGFTQESFSACLKNQELLDNVLSIQKKAAEDYGVDATPTFFINGTKYSGSMSAEDMGKAIDALV
ncbi:MAG: DsbA family protein [Rhizobiaceae bacterium]